MLGLNEWFNKFTCNGINGTRQKLSRRQAAAEMEMPTSFN